MQLSPEGDTADGGIGSAAASVVNRAKHSGKSADVLSERHVAIGSHQIRDTWAVARSILDPGSHRGVWIHSARSLEFVEEG
jgi:hypothetical protein